VTQRTPRQRDPRSRWLNGIAEISAFSGASAREVADALRSGELRGRQRTAGGRWRTHEAWVDAWLAGEEAPSISDVAARDHRRAG